MSDAELAAVLAISVTTLIAWKLRDPEFVETMRRWAILQKAADDAVVTLAA